MLHTTEFDAHIQALEANIFPVVPVDRWLVIRLDGIGFSSLAKRVLRERPFDAAFTNAMDAAARAVHERSLARYAYVQSDEITLIIPPTASAESPHLFGGRTHKILTDLASTASIHFLCAIMDTYPTIMSLHPPRFDARCFIVDNARDAYSLLYSRAVSCHRNVVSLASSQAFPYKARHKQSTRALIAMMAKTDTPFESIDVRTRLGTLFHRTHRIIPADDPQWYNIPAQHRPTMPVRRSIVLNHYLCSADGLDAYIDTLTAWDAADTPAP